MDLSSILDRHFKPGYWAYHRFRNYGPVWFYFLNNKARRIWRRLPGQLNPIQQRIASSLKKDGIAVIHISELFPETEFFEAIRAYGFGLLNQPAVQQQIAELELHPPKDKDEMMVHVYGGYGRAQRYPLEVNNPFMRFCLDERVLDTAAAYLELAPKLKMYSLHLMVLAPSDSNRLFSQRWHRDPDDKKLVKAFLYLNDVKDEGVGPFTYVKGTQAGGRWRHLFPQIPPVGSYPKAGEVERVVPPEDIRVCTGRAGTLIFADTSGLHRGGYSTTKRRFMFAATYSSAASILTPKYYVENHTSLDVLSPLARYALTE